jgi:hypothetical protein
VSRHRRFIQFSLAVGLGLLLTVTVIPGSIYGINLLSNGPFENFQSYNGEDWRGFPERYGQDWNVQVLDEDGLHFMDSDTFGQFLTAIFGVPYLNYRLEGNLAQSFASRRGYNFVFSQTVPVSNGMDYAFGGKIVTFWKGAGGETNDTKIFKRIGLDPTGGTDHAGPNVVWTDWLGLDNAWTSPALAVAATSNTVTVFIQVENTEADVGPSDLNTGYIDNFKLELAPVATLNLPAQAAPGPVNVSWSVNIPDSGFWNLWGYDVEFKDNAAGPWQTIQSHAAGNGQNNSYSLNAQAGKTYTFRVRAWQQEAPNGSPVTTALPGLWVEKSILIGQAVIGQVTDHTGLALSGVTISVSGTTTSTLSGSGGLYALPTGTSSDFDVVATDFDGLVAPPAATVNVPAGGAGMLDITLRPTGAAQGIDNNDFEADLANWNTSNGPATGRSGADKHSGQGSLLISNSTTISQVNAVTTMGRPMLSFWHKSDAPFTAEFLTTAGVVRSVTLDPTSDWTHTQLASGLGQAYSGLVGVNFSYPGGVASIYLDEVSIGAGPLPTYLPLISKP